MRVIAGEAKGRRLKAPKGPATRPMTDRVKEAVFSMLGDSVVGVSVADLFAGSGSLGLEALSRGAASAVFVERRRDAAPILHDNIEAVGLGGSVIIAEVDDFLRRPGDRFGVVFVDPPYEATTASVQQLLVELADRVNVGGVVVVHRRHGSGEIIAPERLTLQDIRRYGDAEITRLTREE